MCRRGHADREEKGLATARWSTTRATEVLVAPLFCPATLPARVRSRFVEIEPCRNCSSAKWFRPFAICFPVLGVPGHFMIVGISARVFPVAKRGGDAGPVALQTAQYASLS